MNCDEVRNVVRALRALPSRPVPPHLAARLRVLASHELSRQRSRASWRTMLASLRDRVDLTLQNLMRPVALPAAGGVLAALLMFAMLVPELNFRHNFRNDVPLGSGIYTNASLLEISPFCNVEKEAVVELTIDERGRITDYEVSEGQMTKELANDLMFSRFSPATHFGLPTPGKYYLTFRRGRTIIVRG
jgi:hypothetical protein